MTAFFYVLGTLAALRRPLRHPDGCSAALDLVQNGGVVDRAGSLERLPNLRS